MILVTGGAGYIGSQYVAEARARGEALVVLDNLSRGHREAVPAGVPLVQADICDRAALDALFADHQFDAVVHFAALALVGESVTDPAAYYRTNVVGTLCLLEAMRKHGARYLVFSSTCATYGEPRRIPMDEEHPQQPVNPYGQSKHFVERMLAGFDQAYGLRFAALRYFNAAGADPAARIGESHDPETHLIPLVLQVAGGRRESVTIFGNDYDTADGTCVRDYVHVADLAVAHSLALTRLRAGEPSIFLNLGAERPASVREVISSCERVTGKKVATDDGPRRPGDPDRLVAAAARARQALGWKPEYPDLETIVETAWRWEQQRRY